MLACLCNLDPFKPHFYMSRVVRKPAFCICEFAKTKTRISFAVTAKLISAIFFATRIVQSLHYINPKFQASSHVLWLYSPVCVGAGQKPRRPVFSQRGSYMSLVVRKPGFRVSDQVRHKLGCITTQDCYRLEISY